MGMAIALVDLVFLSVSTPTSTKGFGAGQVSHLRWTEVSFRQLGIRERGHTNEAEKSTVPFRIGSRIKATFTAAPGEVEEAGAPTTIADLSNPERLGETDATLVLARWISFLDLRWFYWQI